MKTSDRSLHRDTFAPIATIVIVGNALVTFWHLLVVAQIPPGLNETVIVAPTIGISVSLLGLTLLWFRHYWSAAVLIFVPTAVGLVIGVLEHFVNSGPFNAFDVSSPEWAFMFRVTTVVLVVVEASGCWVAVRTWFLRTNQQRDVEQL
jgi:hypothetical protein